MFFFFDEEHYVLAVVDCGLNSRYVTAPFPQDMDRQQAKSLGKLSTEEVCQWFTRIGLQKCLPFIRGIEVIPPPSVSFLRPDVAQRRLI